VFLQNSAYLVIQSSWGNVLEVREDKQKKIIEIFHISERNSNKDIARMCGSKIDRSSTIC